jgi:Ribosomal L18 C-terminal region
MKCALLRPINHQMPFQMLSQVHAAIRENPIIEKKERSKPSDAQKWKATKLSYDERKAALKVCRGSQHHAPWHPQLAEWPTPAVFPGWWPRTLTCTAHFQHVVGLRSDCDDVLTVLPWLRRAAEAGGDAGGGRRPGGVRGGGGRRVMPGQRLAMDCRVSAVPLWALIGCNAVGCCMLWMTHTCSWRLVNSRSFQQHVSPTLFSGLLPN